jgi:alanine-glyoxylate transaminase/serine-glyoxylate transaminase/serine-pyruvate transaminase
MQALAAPVVGHLDPVFIQCMGEVRELLRFVFETANPMTLALSATGSGGMEAALANLLEPGDTVAIGLNGYFGQRLEEMARRLGADVVGIEAEWGRPVALEQVARVLETTEARLVCLVHAETSTGVLQPLEGLGELMELHDACLVVDAVTSLGGHSVGADRHGIDVCYSGTQKALSAPPGLAPITFSERAMERIRSRKTKPTSWYLDILLVDHYWGERVYHHTAPVSLFYALREALRIIQEEGLEARWRRHELSHRALVAGLEAMGIEMLVEPADRLWTLNAVLVPEGVEEASVRSRLLKDFSIEIGAGLGPLRGKIWRIGLMGGGSTRNNILILLSALEDALVREGFRPKGSGVSAALAVYSSE